MKRRFFIALAYIGLILIITLTINPITFTIDRIKISENMPQTNIEKLLSNTVPPELWLFLGIGVTLLFIGVFVARLTYFWLPLIVIGAVSVLSSSGEFLRIYQIGYVFDGYDFINILDEGLDDIKFLLPGIACIIGGLILRRRQNIQRIAVQ